MSESKLIGPLSLFPSETDEAFGHWLSGFTDGEGNFMLYMEKQRKHFTPHARFSIELRADDRPILESIRLYLDCGKIYDRGINKRCSYMSTFAVQDVPSLATKIIPHFERFSLRAKKAADFTIWKQGINFIARIRKRPRRGSGPNRFSYCRWNDEDCAHYLSLLKQLREGRTFRPPVASQ